MKIVRKIPSPGNQSVSIVLSDGTEYIFRASEDRPDAPLSCDVANMEHVAQLLAAPNVFMLDASEALPVEPSKEAELQAALDEKNGQIEALEAELTAMRERVSALSLDTKPAVEEVKRGRK